VLGRKGAEDVGDGRRPTGPADRRQAPGWAATGKWMDGVSKKREAVRFGKGLTSGNNPRPRKSGELLGASNLRPPSKKKSMAPTFKYFAFLLVWFWRERKKTLKQREWPMAGFSTPLPPPCLPKDLPSVVCFPYLPNQGEFFNSKKSLSEKSRDLGRSWKHRNWERHR